MPVTAAATQDAGQPGDARHKMADAFAARARDAAATPKPPPRIAADPAQQKEIDSLNAIRAAGGLAPGRPGQRGGTGPALQALPQASAALDPAMPLGTATTPRRATVGAAPRVGAAAAAAPRYGATYTVANSFKVNPSYANQGVITVRVTNTGSATWNSSFSLGSHVYRADGSNYAFEGAITSPSWSIAPGFFVDVDAAVTPLPAGTFSVVFDMRDDTNSAAPYFSQNGVPAARAIRFTVPHYAPTAELRTPLSGDTTATLQPTLTINLVSDATVPTDADIQICPTADAAGGCNDSLWFPVPTNADTFVVPASLTVTPGAIGFWNQTVFWRVRVRDPGVTTPWSATSPFTPTVPAPAAFGLGADPATTDAAGVGLFAGNYVRSETDLSLPVPGGSVPLGVSRVYNSASLRTGAFGYAWASLIDVTVTLNTTSNGENLAAIVFPDGHQVRYAQNSDISWTPNIGESTEQTFVSDGTDKHLDLGDGTRYIFVPLAGTTAYVLGQINAPSGDSLVFGQSGGHISRLTDLRSGRSLYLTWTGGVVTSVSTAPTPTAGAVTWTYAYTAGLLTRVCDSEPTPNCTTYAYGQAASLPRLITITRANTANVTTIDYNGLYVARVGDARNAAGQFPNSWTYSRAPSPVDLTLTVTDPAGVRLTYQFGLDGLLKSRAVGDPSVAGHTRLFQYDFQGRISGVLDENGNPTQYFWDSRAGAIQDVNRSRDNVTVVGTHIDYLGGADPAHRALPLSIKDANGNTTTMTYRGGLLATRTTPPTTAAAAGATTRYAYTCDGGVAAPTVVNDPGAPAGSLQPCGLLASMTGPDGLVTRFAYNHFGDRTRQITPTGLTTDDVYDALGRMISRTVTTPGEPGTARTTFTSDTHGRPATETGPSVRNPVTGVFHQRANSVQYDGDGNVALETTKDLAATQADPTRTTGYTYDNHDRPAGLLRNGQLVSRTNYDGMGRLAQSFDGNGAEYDYSYDAYGLLRSVVLANMVDSPITSSPSRRVTIAQYAYDNGGRLATYQNALNHVVRFTYTADDLTATETLVGLAYPYSPSPPAHDVVLHSYTYDLAGNVVRDAAGTVASARTSTYAYDAVNQPTSAVTNPVTAALPFAVPRTTTFGYDPAGRPTSTTTAQNGSPAAGTQLSYDAAGQLTASTVRNTPADLVTRFTRDGAGHLLSSTDPRGATPGDPAFTTTYTNDLLGRLVQTTLPSVQVQDGTGTPASAVRPSSTAGYDVLGELVDASDARGQVTHISYDTRGRRASVTYPRSGSVVPTESWTYDNNDNVITHTDRRGAVTVYRYDTRNRPYRVELPAAAAARPIGIASLGYDDDNNVLTRTDPTGAVVKSGFDTMDRIAYTNRVERNFDAGDKVLFVGYTDFGEPTSVTDAFGTGAFTTYDNFGMPAGSSATGEGTTAYQHDVGDRISAVTDPLGRATTYDHDPAGRLTTVTHYDPASDGFTDRSTYGYDPAGNPTTYVDPAGRTWSAAYDAASRVVSRTDPPTGAPAAVTRFGYDAAGNQTAVTDANGNATFQTYQEWNLPAQRLEPATTAHPAVTDRTSKVGYDASGSPATVSEPGGVNRVLSYDQRGRLVGITATGGDGGGGKTFGYDEAGRPTSADGQAFAYNDRGLMVSSSGPQGTSGFGYDSLGRLTNQSDGAGSVSYTYSGLTDVGTINDDLTSTLRTFAHDPAGQVMAEQDTNASTGARGPRRTWAYDNRGRLLIDTVSGPGGQATATMNYSYDVNGNVTTATYGGGLGGGSRSYGYDAANRLTGWTGSGTRESYTRDVVGNRTGVTATTGTVTQTTTYAYDQRNRLLSSSRPGSPTVSTANTWSPRGTLQSTATTTGASTVTRTNRFDAFDRLIGSGGSNYAYDALDRLTAVTTGGTTQGLGYAGISKEPSADGQWSYARTTSGAVLGARSNGAPATGVLANVHQDAVAGTDPGTGAVTESRVYDPFGKVISSTGNHPPVGFQGSWTDPGTGLAHAQARWYDPTTGTFASADPSTPGVHVAADANHYLYGNANPTTFIDPTGLWQTPVGPVPLPGAPPVPPSAVSLLARFGGFLGGFGAAIADTAVVGGVIACVASVLCAAGVVVGAAVVGGLAYEILGDDGSAPIRAPQPARAPAPGGRPSVPRAIPSSGPAGGGLMAGLGAALSASFNSVTAVRIQPPSPATSAVRAPAPPPPRPVVVTATVPDLGTVHWGTTSKWFDDSFTYTRVDHFSQTIGTVWTYFSNGHTSGRPYIGAVEDQWTVAWKPTRDVSNPVIVDIPAPPPPSAPAGPAPAPTAAACGSDSGTGCTANPVRAGPLPPQALAPLNTQLADACVTGGQQRTDPVGETYRSAQIFTCGDTSGAATFGGPIGFAAPAAAAAASVAGNPIAVIGRLADTDAAIGWPGHEVLAVSNWTIDKNDQWVRSVIDRKMDVYVGTSPTFENRWDGDNGRPRVLAREIDQFRGAGYQWDGWYLRAPAGG